MEAQVLLWIHHHGNAALDAFFRVSHFVGGYPASAGLVAALALWHVVRHERREALAWLALGLSTAAVLEVLKAVAARARPDLWPRIVMEPGFSFPSGHALASATFYPILAWEASRRRPDLWRLWYAIAVAGSFWVGFGRLYLGVHWPSDVLTGWTLGAAQAAIAIRSLGSKERP